MPDESQMSHELLTQLPSRKLADLVRFCHDQHFQAWEQFGPEIERLGQAEIRLWTGADVSANFASAVEEGHTSSGWCLCAHCKLERLNLWHQGWCSKGDSFAASVRRLLQVSIDRCRR